MKTYIRKNRQENRRISKNQKDNLKKSYPLIENNFEFIKKLKKIGFYMLQFSVYTKVLINQSEYDRIIKKVKQEDMVQTLKDEILKMVNS